MEDQRQQQLNGSLLETPVIYNSFEVTSHRQIVHGQQHERSGDDHHCFELVLDLGHGDDAQESQRIPVQWILTIITLIIIVIYKLL